VSLTIIRNDLSQPLELIIGQDVAADQAEALVASGAAVPGPDYELPPAIYLLVDVEIHGFTYPAGAQLQVGGEIDQSEALLLIRGQIGDGGGIASVPRGGIG
jgi:hypothetical protein